MASYPAYIPAPVAEFAAWLLNFSTLLTASPTTYGLTAPNAVTVAGLNSTFQAAYTAATNPLTRTASTISARDAARSAAEVIVRPFAVQISRNSGVTNPNKIAIGVTVKSVVPTPVPAPTVAPVLSLVAATPLATKLAFKAVGAVGKAKPFGVVGVEVWRSVGVVAATDPEQCVFYCRATKSPFFEAFPSEQQGKICTHFARFTTLSGPQGIAQVGPWSSALVTIVQ